MLASVRLARVLERMRRKFDHKLRVSQRTQPVERAYMTAEVRQNMITRSQSTQHGNGRRGRDIWRTVSPWNCITTRALSQVTVQMHAQTSLILVRVAPVTMMPWSRHLFNGGSCDPVGYYARG